MDRCLERRRHRALAALHAERPYFWGSTPELIADRAGVRLYFESQLAEQDRPRVVIEPAAEREVAPDVSELAARALGRVARCACRSLHRLRRRTLAPPGAST